jgi:hypothetical protein
MGKMLFHFKIISFMPLQVQSNLDKSSSDSRELKNISEEIFRSIIDRNNIFNIPLMMKNTNF